MSIYGFVTRETVPAFEPTPVTNDTLIGDYSSYLRWNAEENTYQMSSKIDPRTEGEGVWKNIPSSVYDAIHPEGGGKTLTVGQLINRLSQQEQMHADEVTAHNKSRNEAQRAIALIGERLIQESNDRSWCSEFDELIDNANEKLPAWLELPTRVREFNVTWTEQYTITVRRHATFEAKNEEEACDMARDYSEEADDYEMKEAIQYGNYSYDTDNGDYEAEEA
jgi:hypothetical protein